MHHTAEFFCANMTVEMDNTDKLKVLVQDALKFGLSFDPPDVNRGSHRFEPVSDKVIRYGLGAIKGTGQQAIEAIVAARLEGGAFTSLFDFCARVDRARLNKRAVEALIKAGAFDSLQRNRAALAASIDRAFDFASAQTANALQVGLFDMGDGDKHGSSTQEPELVDATPWGVKEQLTLEKTALGFYLSGHLFDATKREVRQFARRPLDEVSESRDPQLLAGIVTDLRVINGARGKMALFRLDDGAGVVEARADEALLNANRLLLRDDELVIVMGKLQPDRFSGGLLLTVNQLWDLPSARCRFGKYLRVAVNGHNPDVRALVGEFPARREASEQGDLLRGLPVRLCVERRSGGSGHEAGTKPDPVNGATAAGVCFELQLGEQAQCFPSDKALAGWTAQAAQGGVAVIYE